MKIIFEDLKNIKVGESVSNLLTDDVFNELNDDLHDELFNSLHGLRIELMAPYL